MTIDQLMHTINTPNENLWLVHKNMKDVVFAPVYAKETPDSIQVTGQWISVAMKPAVLMVIEIIKIKKDLIKDWFFLVKPLTFYKG